MEPHRCHGFARRGSSTRPFPATLVGFETGSVCSTKEGCICKPQSRESDAAGAFCSSDKESLPMRQLSHPWHIFSPNTTTPQTNRMSAYANLAVKDQVFRSPAPSSESFMLSSVSPRLRRHPQSTKPLPEPNPQLPRVWPSQLKPSDP